VFVFGFFVLIGLFSFFVLCGLWVLNGFSVWAVFRGGWVKGRLLTHWFFRHLSISEWFSFPHG
jgi:hypothetical protein